MVTKQDIDQVQRELQELRTLLMTARDKVRPRVESLLEQTETLQAQECDAAFRPTLRNTRELLMACRRGFEVSDCVMRTARHARVE